MLKVILVSLMALSVAACAGKTSSDASGSASTGTGTLAVTAAFSPDPPTLGTNTITITVKDATGAPVRGAHVKIATNMPTMSMKGPGMTANDNGDGTYTTSAKLEYRTKWSFAIAGDANGQHGTTTINKEVP